MSDYNLNWDEQAKITHETILKFGYSEWSSLHQMSSEQYHRTMGKINPFAKAYFQLFDRYMLAERLLKEAQSERDHYKTRYLDIADNARNTMKSFASNGVHLQGVTMK